MANDMPKVRPLNTDGQAGTSGRPPRLSVVFVFLVIGVAVGWGFAALSGDDAPAPPEAAAANGALTEDSREASTVNWVQATQVPTFPDGYEYMGATDPIEFGNEIFLAVRFRSLTTGATRSDLWRSSDGLSWQSEPLDLGESVAVLDLVATDTGIILTGDADGYAMWRSIPRQPVDGGSWIRLDIEVPDGLAAKCHRTVVDDGGQVVTVVIGSLGIWRDAVAPFVPADIDPYDPCLLLSRGSVYVPEERTSIQLFSEDPEVVTTDDSIWVRLVTLEGEEIIHSYSVPAGAHPVETTPDLSYVRVAISWYSPDGTVYVPVLEENALPDGYFLPLPWQGGFITAAYELANSSTPFEDVKMWESSSGRSWEQTETQPPPECSRYTMAIGADRILLTGRDGTMCSRTVDGDWTVIGEPSTATYTIGGPAGFIGYPKGFDYVSGMFSPDGEHWSKIDIPSTEPYPKLVVLESRLFALSAHQTDPASPKHVDIWIGEIS